MARAPGTRGRRSNAEATRTRARILDQAERLFARSGYGAVTTREVARRARVRPYTVQYHFGSKPALFEAVLRRWDGALRERVTGRLAAERDLRAVVRALVGELLDFLIEHRDWVAVSVRSALGDGLPKGVRTADVGWVELVADTLRRHPATRGADAPLLVLTIEGVLHNHVLAGRRYGALFGRDLRDPALRTRLRRHVEHTILAVLDLDDAGPAR